MVGSISGEEEDEVEATVTRRLFPIGRLDPSVQPWCPASSTAMDITSAQRMTAAMLDI